MGYDMDQIVWLSPWYTPDGTGPYQTGFSIQSGSVDKVFLVPELESQNFTLGAEKNLAYGQQEARRLQALKLPGVLEPVRS